MCVPYFYKVILKHVRASTISITLRHHMDDKGLYINLKRKEAEICRKPVFKWSFIQ